MSQRSNRKAKQQAELMKKGVNPKGTSYFWNKSIPEGYTFNFQKKKRSYEITTASEPSH